MFVSLSGDNLHHSSHHHDLYTCFPFFFLLEKIWHGSQKGTPNGQTNRQTDKQTNGQTDRQTDIRTKY